MSTLHVECVRDRCMFGDDLQRNNHSVTVVWSRGPCSCIISRDCECSAPAYLTKHLWAHEKLNVAFCPVVLYFMPSPSCLDRGTYCTGLDTWIIALSDLNSLPPPTPPEMKVSHVDL